MVIYCFLKGFLANIHLGCCALALLTYFSRRELAMNVVIKLISVFTTLSILAGGLFIGKGNLYAVFGAMLVIAAAPFDR